MREGKHGHKEHHGRHRGHGHGEHHGHGRAKEGKHTIAQTFRRGRAVSFLERLQVKRSTLLQQLNQPEYEAIKQVISGELKAVDAIIQEFIHTFELVEAFPADTANNSGDDVLEADEAEDELERNKDGS